MPGIAPPSWNRPQSTSQLRRGLRRTCSPTQATGSISIIMRVDSTMLCWISSKLERICDREGEQRATTSGFFSRNRRVGGSATRYTFQNRLSASVLCALSLVSSYRNLEFHLSQNAKVWKSNHHRSRYSILTTTTHTISKTPIP